jgi:cytochrome d ubiquinol oxidase subunit II
MGNGGFYAGYVAPWLQVFPVAVGLLALACFAFLASVYLTLEATDPELQEDFRQRAILSGAAVFVMAGVGLALSPDPRLVGPRLVALTAAAALGTFWSLWRRRYRLARVAAAAQVTLILWGWGVAQYPYLLPPELTIANAAAPRVTLELALVAVTAGAIVLFPSLYYLFRVFKGGHSKIPIF